MQKSLIKIGSYASLILLALFTFMFIKAGINGQFESKETFQAYMASYGIFAPIVLGIFQIVQVILPILPGLLGCAVGSIMFGPFVGFLCNYIGICTGSLIAFILGRKFGSALVDALFHSEKYKVWADRAAESKSYTLFLFVAMLLPLFPDDYLCYFSGLSSMTFRKFTWIILLGKPWCILAYCIGFSFIG